MGPVLHGSSPLTRGKRCAASHDGVEVRLIPAHAGKTWRRIVWASLRSAHPRSRGENWLVVVGDGCGDGSSPLTRGKPARIADDALVTGLIPAHAGKTMTCPSTSVTSRAHPRSRGENPARGGELAGAGGSSPLTRGKRIGRLNDLRQIRLIPAHAGKTRGGRRLRAPDAAHPRSRGENSVAHVSPTSLAGSSPLTRGKLPNSILHTTRLRLIPAHAGKTDRRWKVACRGAAHPRSRGENDDH